MRAKRAKMRGVKPLWKVIASSATSVAVLSSGAVHADPLVGDVGAAYSTAEAANVNPANAGFLDRTQAMFVPELFKQESLSVRYPGFEPTTVSDSGMGSIMAGGRPAFIFKPNSRFGVGGYFLPPVGLEVEIHKEQIPVIILGQQSFIDLDAVGRPDGIGQFIAGYKITDRLGVGLSAGIQNVSFEAKLTPSDGGDVLAEVTGSTSDVNVGSGVRYDLIPNKLSVGVVAGLVSMSKREVNIESPLLQSSEGGSGAPEGGSGGHEATTPMNSFIFGIQAGLGPKFKLLTDLHYTRADKTQQTFSLVDLKTKTRDVHDVLALRMGIIMGLTDSSNVLLGFRYEPSPIGPGSPGEDGTAGFGTVEVVQIFTGLQTMTPFWQVSAGIQHGLSPKALPRGKDKDEPRSYYYQWTIGTGIVYRRASLGIDENGELPGAYLYKKTSIPVAITYKF